VKPDDSRILVVDDDAAVGKVLAALMNQAGYAATWADSAESGLNELARRPYDIVISDVRMPGMDGMSLLEKLSREQPELPVVLLTAHGSVPMAVEAMRKGAADFLLKPFDRDEVLFVVKKALEGTKAARQAPPPRQNTSDLGLVGSSPEMESVREMIRKAAPAPTTVLIRGESGTGKELVARAIHALSPRAKGPFVKLNCGALPEALFESELFGYEKGAFTGATQRKPGRAELASGGTLFLDEVGDLPAAMQVKLLRLLQEKEFERLGGTETLKADVRVVAATHRPLEEMMKAGTFREDLFYRLNVVPIPMPALRSRSGDIGALATHFTAEIAKTHGRAVKLTPEALQSVSAATWPGNVRQLQNFIERLIVLSGSDAPSADDVKRELSREQQISPVGGGAAAEPAAGTLDDRRASAERAAVEEALQKAKGNRSLAARLLGVSRRTLYNKLAALGLEPA
jgi:DNA-binding NtrC family response regulator